MLCWAGALSSGKPAHASLPFLNNSETKSCLGCTPPHRPSCSIQCIHTTAVFREWGGRSSCTHRGWVSGRFPRTVLESWVGGGGAEEWVTASGVSRAHCRVGCNTQAAVRCKAGALLCACRSPGHPPAGAGLQEACGCSGRGHHTEGSVCALPTWQGCSTTPPARHGAMMCTSCSGPAPTPRAAALVRMLRPGTTR